LGAFLRKSDSSWRGENTGEASFPPGKEEATKTRRKKNHSWGGDYQRVSLVYFRIRTQWGNSGARGGKISSPKNGIITEEGCNKRKRTKEKQRVDPENHERLLYSKDGL